MQEDGSAVLVDSNHHRTSHVEIQKIDPALVNILDKPILPRLEEPSVSAAQPKVAQTKIV